MPTNAREILVEDHHKETYSNNVRMVAQQKMPRVRGSIEEVPASGEAMSASDLFGKSEARRGNARDRKNIDNPIKNSRRWLVRPEPIEDGCYIDTVEKLDRAMDPESRYIEAYTKSVIRGVDDICMGVEKVNGVYRIADGGILGTASEGRRGEGKSDLPAKCFTPHNDEGLTTEKLLDALKRLRLDEFGMEDDEQVYGAVSAHEIDDLLRIALETKTSLNGFDVEELKTGKPRMLLGVNWIWTNRIPVKADNTARMMPLWCKSNVVAGIWQDIQGQVWNDTHQKNTPVCLVDAYIDAVRIEDDGVHVIETKIEA